MSTRRKISMVRWVVSFLIMVPLVTVWGMFLSDHWLNYEIISASMSPTLEVGDRVIMKRERDFTNLRDHIIAFKDPGGESTALTKRVVAESNSKVQLRNGRVYVDSAISPLAGELIEDVANRTWDVGPGQVFVLGDNRNDSYDSIDYGPIPRSSILGVLIFRYAPWSRRGSLQP